MYGKEEYGTEKSMELELVVIEGLTAQDAFSFLNLAVAVYAPNVLSIALEEHENLGIIESGQNPLNVGRNHFYPQMIHEAAKKEPRRFVICTSENGMNYINAITFDNEIPKWVLSRQELDIELEINPSIMFITPETLGKIYDNLLPILGSAIKRRENLTNISITDLESISSIADFFKSITEGSSNQRNLIYQAINDVILLKKKNHNIPTSEQTRYTNMLKKSYFTLATDYYISGYEENKIDNVLLQQAFNYLQKLMILSPDHEEAVKLASRMFILIQNSVDGKKISLADTTFLGNDVIKSLLTTSSFATFKSIANAMGIQYQNGFNDGKMFTQSKDGLKKSGMFSPGPFNEENIVTATTPKFGSSPGLNN